MNPDAVQVRVLEALERRAQAVPPGPLQTLLRLRAQQWRRRFAVDADRDPAEVGAAASVPAQPAPVPDRTRRASALADLVQGLPPFKPSQPLRSLQAHARDWSALRVAQRLTEPMRHEVPDATAGPLHPQVLVPAVLQRLQALSPDYLAAWVGQLDALSLLEQAVALRGGEAETVAKTGKTGKTGRTGKAVPARAAAPGSRGKARSKPAVTRSSKPESKP